MKENTKSNTKTDVGTTIEASSEKLIPKFATGVGFAKLPNGNIAMIFSSYAPSLEKNAPPIVIETIMVDESHAKRILETLRKVIETKHSSAQ